MDDTQEDICEKLSTSWIGYADLKCNNMKHFKYVGDISEGLDDSNLHALDYYIVTHDVVCAAKQMYDEEVSDGSFFKLW